MNSIPFTNPTGLEYSGLVHLDETDLVVEFQKWSWRRLSRQLVEVRIPVDQIATMRHKKGFVSDRIDLQLRSMAAIGEIPSRKPGLIELRFSKEHREAAQSMAFRLSAAIAELHVERLDDELRRM